MAICWERAVPLAFHLCCFYFSAVLIVGVPLSFGVYSRMWNSIVSIPGHCLFIYFKVFYRNINSRTKYFKTGLNHLPQYFITDRSKAVPLMWLILIVRFLRFLFAFDVLLFLLRTAGHLLGKSCPLRLPPVLFYIYLMPSQVSVLLSFLVSWAEYGLPIYQFLLFDFPSAFQCSDNHRNILNAQRNATQSLSSISRITV